MIEKRTWDQIYDEIERRKYLEMMAEIFQRQRAKRERETGIMETFDTEIDLSEVLKND
jgi:hypothetical protein